MCGLTRCKLIYRFRRSQLYPDSTALTLIKRRLKSKVHPEMVVREKNLKKMLTVMKSKQQSLGSPY